MSGIDLTGGLPIWSATIWHSEPGATNPWNRAFNVSPGDDESQRKEALRICIGLFVADGLSEITIYRIETAPLIPFEEGESDA